jgi:hypothetical protein
MSYKDTIYEADIPDEYRWERIRIYRDHLLQKTDNKMVIDAPWDIEIWKKYRQELRDLPSTNSDPSKIEFPSEPS